ncbi:alkane hydroxylase MAH1-like [Benincasa hispida]|uniref:alkane hydroxylase MAH1-like n=1 Tax=Benincasa hispida TaxID=102211 RepID=UPI001901BB63|nr:alkane hydroxylase MAH1-like [Benincasa hispida]
MAFDLNFLPIFLISLPFIFILFSLFLKWNPHGLPWNWPILGMIPTVIHHIHRVHDRITEVLQITSCTFYFKGIWFTNTGFLMTVDPSNIHHIMSTNFQNYPKGPEFKYIFDVLGDGIFNSDSDSWKNQRKIAQSLIVHEKFLEFMARAAMEKVEKGLVPILDYFCENKSLVVDLKDLFLRLAFDSTCMMVTGFDLNSLCLEFPEIPFSKAMDDVQEVLFLRHLYPKLYWELLKKLGIGETRRMKKACDTIDEVIANLMAVKRERLQRDRELKELQLQDRGADLITWYMVNKYDEIDCNDKFFRDTVLNFMIAGRDALSVTLSWLFFILSKNPIIIEKIREELKTITIVPQNELESQNQPQQKPRVFTIEELNNLVYLHGALCETLRLYPPIAFEHKSPAEADTLPSGHHVKPGTRILVSLYALGRMRCVWGQDCEEFKPERWISDKGTIKREPSYKFFSFNAGPRTCLGKGVAFSQLKIVSAAIIYNYDIEAVAEDINAVAAAASVILHMKSGFKVKVSKR